MKKLFVFLGIALWAIGSAASAQEVGSTAPMQKSSWGDAETSEIADYIPDVSLDMRGSYRLDPDFKYGRFSGDDLYIDINGYISPQFSYSFNYTVANPYYGEFSGVDAINWLTLTYEVGDFAFSAGKDALMMGSFEYDTYNIDSYYEMNSAFYNEFECWQFGASAAWYPAEDQELLLQIANSPFASDTESRFSFALGWRGAWDCYESYWTTNLWQYGPDSFVKAINLGNRFYFGNFTVDLDLMGRFAEMEAPFSGLTSILSPSYHLGERGRIFTKVGIDTLGEEENIFYGAGFEYFPLAENKDIRLHAIYTHNDYTVGDLFSIGLTWKMNLTGNIKKLLGAIED